jgi:arylsulfatase A-like enzyme
LYPVCHGAHWEHLKLDEELGTLAEVLRAHGYQTIGLSENPLISTRAKFAQGFDTFVHSRRRGQDTNVQFKEALEQKGEKALFVFVNLMAAHAPYNSSAQFFKTFLSDPAYGNAFHADLLSYLIRGKDRLGAKWLAHLTEHYDAEVRYDDFLVQQMVQALESTGLWDSTLFIVTSDHGENLGEHDLLDHQFCLYEMLVRVPLIIHYPERFPPASHDYRFVQLTDVFPTVLRIVGIDPKEYPSHGRSLLPGETARDRVMLFEYYLHQGFTERHDEGLGKGRDWGKKFSHPRVQRFSRRLQAVRAGNMKFIRGDDGVEELYDLREDPREERNLITEEAFADVGKRLERMINERLSMYASLREPRAGEPVKLDEEDIRQLKALGYI